MINFSTYLANLRYKTRFFLITIVAVLSAFTLLFITRQGGFFPSGFMGLSLALDTLLDKPWVFPLFMFATNFPPAVMAFFKVGRRFTVISFWYIAVVTVVYSFFSNFLDINISLFDLTSLDTTSVRLIATVVGGIIYGTTLSFTYMLKGCAGGIDYISMYVTTVKKKPFALYSGIISGSTMFLIVFFSVFLKEGLENGVWSFYNIFNTTLYLTFIFIFVVNITIHNLYPRYKKVSVTIITSKGYELSRFLVQRNFPHKHTYLHLKSSGSGRTKTQVRVVILYNQYSDLLKKVKVIDPKAFLTVGQLLKVDGKLKEPKLD